MTKTILALSSLYPHGLEGIEERFRVIRLWQEKDPDAAIKAHRDDIVAVIATPGRNGSRM